MVFQSVRIVVLLLILTLAKDSCSQAVEGSSLDYRLKSQQVYAVVDGQSLMLDLYLPRADSHPPLVVWVHGGAWRSGTRASMPLKWLVRHGFAVASIDYRLSPVARFPAQIFDCKAAIRFLRAKQDAYGVDATRIAIAGASAGGHLAALVGMSNGIQELEGNVGGNAEQSSAVQATIDYYGPTNFGTILKQSTPHGLGVRIPALQLLLGSQPEDNETLARLASPVFHVDASDPPLLMFHGDQDPQVPIGQSHELHGVCKQYGVDARFEVVHGGAHGGAVFYDAIRRKTLVAFCRTHLMPQGP